MATTTIKSLTENQIHALRREAATAGDFAQVMICDRALGDIDADDYTLPESSRERSRIAAMSQEEAQAEVVRAISEAEAQAVA